MLTPIKEFKEEEFRCQCGRCDYGYEDMDEAFLSKLFTARKKSLLGYTLTSAVRCPNHELFSKNPTSSHNAIRSLGKKCKAVDIAVPTSSVAFEVIASLMAAGFTRIGWNRDKKFIHVDDDKSKPARLFFSY